MPVSIVVTDAKLNRLLIPVVHLAVADRSPDFGPGDFRLVA